MSALTQTIAVQPRERAVPVLDPDSEIIARFVSGDASAFELLFAKYRDYVYNISYQMVQDADDASDLTQETFFRVWRALPHFQGNSQFSTWLYRIAVNTCISELRRRPKVPPISIEDEESLSPLHQTEDQRSAEQTVMRRFAQERIREVVGTLPPDYKTVITLRHFQDLSYQEIATIMGCSVGAIKIKLHRARKMFRTRYAATQEGD
ncbi:MAG TPA: sigma-70 family RNA polymerase sigma factor [Armatimonadota bacterium]|nr:sigma-70 family RNA polymerase sigma factor [Armatimonadota bacterium]